MSTETSSSSSGIGVFGLLGVLFVALKLLGVIDWSWWWVTIPFWGGFGVIFGLLILVAIFSGIAAMFGRK
jgi:hypothetical protein